MRPIVPAAVAACLALTLPAFPAAAATILNMGGVGYTVQGELISAGLYFVLKNPLAHGQRARITAGDLSFLQAAMYGNVELHTLTRFDAEVFAASDDEMGLHLISMTMEGYPAETRVEHIIFADEKNWRSFDRQGQLLASGTLWGVPEPASWAMMLAGLGMIGSAVRRSRTRTRCQTASGDRAQSAAAEQGRL